MIRVSEKPSWSGHRERQTAQKSPSYKPPCSQPLGRKQVVHLSSEDTALCVSHSWFLICYAYLWAQGPHRESQTSRSLHSECDPVSKRRVNLVWEKEELNIFEMPSDPLSHFSLELCFWCVLYLGCPICSFTSIVSCLSSSFCFVPLAFVAVITMRRNGSHCDILTHSHPVVICSLLPSLPSSVPPGGFLLFNTMFLLSRHTYPRPCLLYLPPNSL